MLEQYEIDFYGYNPYNVIRRAQRGKISVVLRYHSFANRFSVTRRTKNTFWRDYFSFDELEKAKELFYIYLYSTNEQLENKLRNGGLLKNA